MNTREPEPVGLREAGRSIGADDAPIGPAGYRDRVSNSRATTELSENERLFASNLALEKIPALLALLAERLRSLRVTSRNPSPQPERLLTAVEMAERLSVPESWIRTEERARRIPGVRVGRYVRFRASEVEAALEGNGPR